MAFGSEQLAEGLHAGADLAGVLLIDLDAGAGDARCAQVLFEPWLVVFLRVAELDLAAAVNMVDRTLAAHARERLIAAREHGAGIVAVSGGKAIGART